jgi:hypothetical protein
MDSIVPDATDSNLAASHRPAAIRAVPVRGQCQVDGMKNTDQSGIARPPRGEIPLDNGQ